MNTVSTKTTRCQQLLSVYLTEVSWLYSKIMYSISQSASLPLTLPLFVLILYPSTPFLPYSTSHSYPFHPPYPLHSTLPPTLPPTLPSPSHPPFPHPTSVQRCLEVGLALRPCWRSTLAEDTSFRSSNSNLAAITQRPEQRKGEETLHVLRKSLDNVGFS